MATVLAPEPAAGREADELRRELTDLQGAIARAKGDRRRAIDALHRAVEKRPEEWASYFILAQLYARKSPRLAREQLAIAKRKNPYEPQIPVLQHKLAAQRHGSGD